MRPFLVAVRLKERKSRILLFGVAKVKLKEQNGHFLHFEAAKGRLKE